MAFESAKPKPLPQPTESRRLLEDGGFSRYRTLLEEIPLAIWEADWSALKIHVDKLRSDGITDFERLFMNNRDLVLELADKVKNLGFNQYAMLMYRTPDRETFIAFDEEDDFLTEDEYQSFRETLTAFVIGENRIVTEGWEKAYDGTDLRFRVTTVIPEGSSNDWSRIIHITEDMTETFKLSEKIAYQASHDSLTGLINRYEFEQRLNQAIEITRSDNVEHVLGYLDLDQFKIVNDTLGHVAGDELLRQVGNVLEGQVRKHDTLARLGGDEFGVLMEHCTIPQARRVANNILGAIEKFRFVWEGHIFHIGVSIGLAPLTETNRSVTNALSTADSACYTAKGEGRNRVHVFETDDMDLACRQSEMRWVVRIDQALEDERFRLWSQPIVSVIADPDEGMNFEFLLRLIDERGETILPEAFLPAAERYGLSIKLDRWVIVTALNWLSRNPKLLERLHMCFVNLSSSSLADPEFLTFVLERFEQLVIPPKKICFEITETATIANLSKATAFMEALRRQGCRFALDDFGSGLSSFAYLKTLPVDYLKIDGTFVKNIVDDEMDLAIVRSINDVGKVMGKQTIAESVESDGILEKLREIGVDYAQGYVIEHPTPIRGIAGISRRSKQGF